MEGRGRKREGEGGRKEGERERERESRERQEEGKEKRRETTLAGLWLSATQRPVVGGGDCREAEGFPKCEGGDTTGGREPRPGGTLGREATEY